MEPKTFILSDESINSYGFRILIAGINITQFKKNPVMFFNHRSYGDKYNGPIGMWDNVIKKDGQLLADSNFDMEDEQGKIIAGKVERGFIKGASMGIVIIETSTDPKHLLPGQTRPTVTKCEIFEASVVDLPSNSSSLALYDASGSMINLSDESSLVRLNQIMPTIEPKPLNPISEMKKLALFIALFKLAQDATEDDVFEAAQKADNQLKEKLARVTELEAKFTELNKSRNEELVSKAIADKKINETQRAAYLSRAEKDYEFTKEILDGMTPVVKLTDKLRDNLSDTGKKQELSQDRNTWTYDDWSKKDSKGLLAMKNNDEDAYNTLLSAKKSAVRERGHVA